MRVGALDADSAESIRDHEQVEGYALPVGIDQPLLRLGASYTGREVTIKRRALLWNLWQMMATACPMSHVRCGVVIAAII